MPMGRALTADTVTRIAGGVSCQYTRARGVPLARGGARPPGGGALVCVARVCGLWTPRVDYSLMCVRVGVPKDRLR